jgi:hypothetical protein
MATNAPAQVVWLANEWEDLYASATISGVIGDSAHAARGGYHISIQDQPSDNYSVKRADDKAPPGDWPRNMASAIDMTLSLADMKKCHGFLRAAFLNRSNDVRMKYINAWNGWNGEGSPGRYDVVTGSIGTATDDHKWHIHLEIRRRYVNVRTAMEAILSILKGETEAQYLGEDDVTKAEFLSWMTEWAKSSNGRLAIQDALLDTNVGNKAYPTRTFQQFINDAWGVRDYEIGDAKGTAAMPVGAGSPLGKQVTAADQTKAVMAQVSDIAKSVQALTKSVGSVDVDEVALAAAITSNAAFVSVLAAAVADRVATGEDVALAVKSVLNGAKIVVS